MNLKHVLKEANITSINVSLDTLNPEKFNLDYSPQQFRKSFGKTLIRLLNKTYM